MNPTWAFAFDNAPLSDSLQLKLFFHNLLNDVPATKNVSPSLPFVKDYFTADGFPKINEGMRHADTVYPYIFPAMASWYTGATVPAAILEADPLWRQTVCQAGLKWLHTVMEAGENIAKTHNKMNSENFHALAFQQDVGGVLHTFAFPDTRIETVYHDTAAIVLIADSYWNDGDWEKGLTPLYAREQAMLQLWCWHQFAQQAPASSCPEDIPEVAFICRVSGNLAVDCKVRTVTYIPAEAESLVRRICKARSLEAQNGLYWKRNIQKVQTWEEKIKNEAYFLDDDDVHELVCEYMKARADRKQLEKELKEIEAQQDGIAVNLASRIPAGVLQGTLDLSDGTKCSVTHTYRRPGHRTIPAELVRSFFPSMEDVIVSGGHRETVTIEYL